MTRRCTRITQTRIRCINKISSIRNTMHTRRCASMRIQLSLSSHIHRKARIRIRTAKNTTSTARGSTRVCKARIRAEYNLSRGRIARSSHILTGRRTRITNLTQRNSRNIRGGKRSTACYTALRIRSNLSIGTRGTHGRKRRIRIGTRKVTTGSARRSTSIGQAGIVCVYKISRIANTVHARSQARVRIQLGLRSNAKRKVRLKYAARQVQLRVGNRRASGNIRIDNAVRQC